MSVPVPVPELKPVFQRGAVVSLRSGGPLMTVEHSTGVGKASERAFCVWFTSGGDLRNEGFLAAVLKAGA